MLQTEHKCFKSHWKPEKCLTLAGVHVFSISLIAIYSRLMKQGGVANFSLPMKISGLPIGLPNI